MAFEEVEEVIQAVYLLTYDLRVNVSFKELPEYLKLRRLFAEVKKDISVRKQSLSSVCFNASWK